MMQVSSRAHLSSANWKVKAFTRPGLCFHFVLPVTRFHGTTLSSSCLLQQAQWATACERQYWYTQGFRLRIQRWQRKHQSSKTKGIRRQIGQHTICVNFLPFWARNQPNTLFSPNFLSPIFASLAIFCPIWTYECTHFHVNTCVVCSFVSFALQPNDSHSHVGKGWGHHKSNFCPHQRTCLHATQSNVSLALFGYMRMLHFLQAWLHTLPTWIMYYIFWWCSA